MAEVNVKHRPTHRAQMKVPDFSCLCKARFIGSPSCCNFCSAEGPRRRSASFNLTRPDVSDCPGGTAASPSGPNLLFRLLWSAFLCLTASGKSNKADQACFSGPPGPLFNASWPPASPPKRTKLASLASLVRFSTPPGLRKALQSGPNLLFRTSWSAFQRLLASGKPSKADQTSFPGFPVRFSHRYRRRR